MIENKVKLAAVALAIATAAPGAAQEAAIAGMGMPANPAVQVSWTSYFDHAGIGELGRRLQQAHPDYCRFSSIGRSYEGREIWLLTVTDFNQGDPDRKPGMYIDGNIHANEIQGTEMALYTAWYLCEMAGEVEWIDNLLRDRVLYIVPTINPDGRDNYLHAPNTASSPRSGVVPRDNDGDGLVDEDGYDDLDGDGYITTMRRRNPNGRWIVSPEDPRIMVRAANDQPGEYELLGTEGFDNDGDGRVNEDGVAFSYDPNRNWPWRWQPRYVQGGADYFPTSLPETQAVVNFVLSHPNIAGGQSYHNSGGMILRGPGVPQDQYRPQDVRVYNQLGEVGEQILPGYRYMVVWRDLYTVWGGELDWFYGAQGILTFSNELFTPFMYFMRDSENSRYDRDSYRFDRLMLFNDAYVPWHEVDHPQYGRIEVGGPKSNFGRATPGFLLPGEAHRNMSFTLYQTHQLPLVRVDSIMTRRLSNGLTEVTAIVVNDRIAPTHTQQDIENHITRPDWISLDGGQVVAGFVVNDLDMNRATEQKRNPQRIEIQNIDGMSSVTVRWIVQGNGPFTVTADSQRGGVSTVRSR